MRLQGAQVVLGVTGGIAAYKAVDLCSKLVQREAGVDVIMTEAATHFVPPLPFQTLSQRPVSIGPFQLLRDMEMAHISLAKKADVLIVAPATANTIAKLAQGLADNLLTSTALACMAPLILAPAMDAEMWEHPATQANIALLRERGAIIAGPASGRLASGRMGTGRLVDTATLLGTIETVLGRNGPLAGRRVLVTAGGTQEPLDPVRHLGNRSSGRMGYALATAARNLGAQVTLVSAPTCLPPVIGAETVSVRTAAEMQQAVLDHCPDSDALIMAAAVADYRPAQAASEKLKKGDGGLMLRLERTADILQSVAGSSDRPRVVVGFAAETENLLRNAKQKLSQKNLDMIVANDVSACDSGFAVDTNRVVLLMRDGTQEALDLMPKAQVADQIMERVVTMLEARDD